MSDLICPSCEKPIALHGGDAKKVVVRCDECGQRVAFGVPVMRMVVTPHPEDTRFIELTFENRVKGSEGSIKVAIDRKGAGEWADAVRSLVRP